MATSTKRPNATAQLGASHSLVGGATAHAVTSDNSDASYVNADASTSYPSESTALEVADWATPADIPTGAKIKAVRTRIRYRATGGARTIYARQVIGAATSSSTAANLDTFFSDGAGTWAEWVGAWHSQRPGGGEWTLADLTSLRIYLNAKSTDNDVAEVYVDVDYNTAPTVAVTGPADEDAGTPGVQVTTTTTPTVTWTFTDTEGDAQEAFRVIVWKSTGGFPADPLGAAGAGQTLAYDSAKVISGVTSHAIATVLENGNYRAYVRAYQPWPTSEHYNPAWATLDFTMAVAAPPVPTVAAADDPTNGRVTLTITRGGGAWPTVPPTSYYVVERSDDGGLTWVPVRNGSALVPAGVATTLHDYEAPPNVQARYRAAAVNAGVGVLQSAWSASATVTHAVTRWELRDPADSTLRLRFYNGSAEQQRRHPVRAGVFEPLGRRNPVVVTDARGGARLRVTLTLVTLADADALEALLDNVRPLYLLSPGTRRWYVTPIDGDEWQTLIHELGESDEASTVTLSFAEVDRPA